MHKITLATLVLCFASITHMPKNASAHDYEHKGDWLLEQCMKHGDPKVHILKEGYCFGYIVGFVRQIDKSSYSKLPVSFPDFLSWAEEKKPISLTKSFEQFDLGYNDAAKSVIRLIKVHHPFCFPANTEGIQVETAVITYLKNNPSRPHDHPIFIVNNALHDAYPC